MSAAEVGLALAWIVSTLSADSTLTGYAPGGVWRGEAPPATQVPYIVVQYKPQQSKTVQVFGGSNAYAELYFDIFAAGTADEDQTIEQAAARIDSLLLVAQSTPVTVGSMSGNILSSYATGPIESDVLITGATWTNMGNEQMIRCKSS